MPKVRKSKSTRSLRETVLNRQAGLPPRAGPQPAARPNNATPVAGSSSLRTQPVFTAERTGSWTDCDVHGITFVEGCEDCEFHRDVVGKLQRNNSYMRSLGYTDDIIDFLKDMASQKRLHEVWPVDFMVDYMKKNYHRSS